MGESGGPYRREDLLPELIIELHDQLDAHGPTDCAMTDEDLMTLTPKDTPSWGNTA